MNQALTTAIFPALVKDRKTNNPIRIWVPGCSTGEEVLTIAMLLIEYLGNKALTIPIQIFGTDLNEKSIEKARTGIYPQSAVQNISKERLQRFFIKLDGQYQIIKTVRDLCIMAQHNLLKDPPFSNMDLVSCQNLLIYLEPGPQLRIMQTFHYALKNKGFLVLGKSETIGIATDLFDLYGKNHKIYQKKQAHKILNFDFAPSNYLTSNYIGINTGKTEVSKNMDIDKELEKILLSQYISPGLLINKELEIVRFLGAVAPYLEPTHGKASFHLLKMVKEDIAYELRTSIIRTKKTGKPETKRGLQITIDQKTVLVDFEVAPFEGQDKELYFLVVFGRTGTTLGTEHDVKQRNTPQKESRIRLLESQIREARHNLKTVSEEFESVRAELQSSNEEALSSNEELQSINEELETSKEELQSMNEELMTINEELHTRNIELKESNDYATAIFESKHEVLIILNEDLKVRIANKGFYQLFQTIPRLTEGKYFDDLGNHQWRIIDLQFNLKSVLKDEPIINFEVRHNFPGLGPRVMLVNAQALAQKDGKKSLILVAIQDITDHEKAQAQVKVSEDRFRLLVQNAFDVIILTSKDGTIEYISPSVENVLGFSPAEQTGKNILTHVAAHPGDNGTRENMYQQCLANTGKNIKAEFRLQHKDGSYRFLEAIAKNMLHENSIKGIVANYRDITDRKILEQQKDDFIGIASHELKTPVTSIKAYAQILEEDFTQSGNPDAAHMAEKMNSQIDRLTHLISDLLDFTHIEADKLKYRFEEYEINKLIYEIADETQRTTSKKLECKLAKTIQIKGDRLRTGEVINNLISNAIKYSPHADKIIIRSKMQKNEITVSVQDFGIGIDPEKVNKIFDRFYRVSDASVNTFPGLGLGLYLAAVIVKKQGGRIWAESELGKGSTFFFTLLRQSNLIDDNVE